jgi:hypothetical protein
VQCRQGHLLTQLLFALLNALPALWAEVLGEFREGTNCRHQSEGTLEGDDLPARSFGRLKNDSSALIDLSPGMGIKRHGATNDFVARGFIFAREGVQIALQIFADPDL